MAAHTLIQNGSVFDGAGGAPASRDVRLRGGLIAEIGEKLPRDGATVVDASGLLVTPGLIDLHAHVFPGLGQFGISPVDAGLRTGVTTLLDAGTTGALTYPALKQLVIDHAPEDIFALLNISVIGCLQGSPKIPPLMGELSDIRYAHISAAVECLKKHGSPLIGVKARLTRDLSNHSIRNERAGFYGALKASEQTGTFLMTHHLNAMLPVEEFLGAMRRGDIVTHLYHGHADSGFVRRSGRPSRSLRAARDRGVILDVGHGAGSFTWAVAEPACQEHGFWPDVISTDIHALNLHGPVFDLATTMTKFLHLGMPLAHVIRASTSSPAQAMRMGDRFGSLKPGRQADVTLLRLESGRFSLKDVVGETRVARRRIVAVEVFKRGRRQVCGAGKE